MSNFLSLNTALTGIRSAQLALDTVSNNVSNANTPGYTRQRVMQAAAPPYQHPAGTVGTGVQITDITRVRDGFLDARLRTTAGTLGYHDTLAALLQRTEQMMSEPDEGLTAALGAVWAAFDDLALDPAEPSARREVLAALESLAGRFRAIDNGWNQLAADTEVRLEVAADEVNEQLARLAKLNELIPAAAFRGTTPTDLLDERDRILDSLSQSLGVQVVERNHSSGVKIADVRLGDNLLVDGQNTGRLEVGPGGSVTLHAADGATQSLADIQQGNAVAGGELGALHHFLATDLPARREALDQVGGAIAHMINTEHNAAWRDDGTQAVAGADLLVPGGDPPRWSTMTVAVTSGEELATARLPDGQDPATWRPSPHDGSAAERMANLRYAKVAGLPTDPDPTAGPRTLDDRLRGLITALARDTAASTREADSAEAVYTSARVARQSVHGVSLDEEMAALVQYQRALEAASRVMTTVDEALDVLINRTGVVGR